MWWQAAWYSAGAAGRLAGFFGVSAFVASYPAATLSVPRASSVPAAAKTARSTGWQKSPHTRLSTGSLQAQQPPPTVLMKILPWRLFRDSLLLRHQCSMLLLSYDSW